MATTMIRRRPVSAEPHDVASQQMPRPDRRAARIDLAIHALWTWSLFGLGPKVCAYCGKRWRQQGCPGRIKSRDDFVSVASATELRQAVRVGLLIDEEAGLPRDPQAQPEPAAPTVYYGDPFALAGVTG